MGFALKENNKADKLAIIKAHWGQRAWGEYYDTKLRKSVSWMQHLSLLC